MKKVQDLLGDYNNEEFKSLNNVEKINHLILCAI